MKLKIISPILRIYLVIIIFFITYYIIDSPSKFLVIINLIKKVMSIYS